MDFDGVNLGEYIRLHAEEFIFIRVERIQYFCNTAWSQGIWANIMC